MPKFGRWGAICSNVAFCGQVHQKQVKKLIAGPGVYICDELHRPSVMRSSKRELTGSRLEAEARGAPQAPGRIYDFLKDYGPFGQDQAKKDPLGSPVLQPLQAHPGRQPPRRRRRAPEVQQSCLLGPHGLRQDPPGADPGQDAGTCHFAHRPTPRPSPRLATSARTFENILLKLIQAADYDVKKAEDPASSTIDRGRQDRPPSRRNRPSPGTCSGEGVQQALLKILGGHHGPAWPPQGGPQGTPHQEFIQIDTLQHPVHLRPGAFAGPREDHRVPDWGTG